MLDTRTTTGHSLLSPSSAHRWAICAGSVRLTLNEENTTSEMAQRGTDIHQLGEMLLNGAQFEVGTSIIRDAGNGMFWANKDMVEEAKAYADYVRALIVGPHAELFVEQKVKIFAEYDMSGSIDACVIDDGTLHIVDLKTGAGEVNAENNFQLMLYAIGAFEEHEVFYDIEKIHLHIVQDNAMIQNTNSWECGVEDLMDFKVWISERARLALQEDSTCTPSEKACQWCAHASKCQALHDYTLMIVKGDFEDLETVEEVVATQSKDEISMEAVIMLLNHKKMIDNVIKAYEQRVTDELLIGKEVPGFKLVQGRKNKKWINEVEAFEKLKGWLPIDDVAPRKLITPTQANKLLGGQVSARKKNAFDKLYEVPEGAIQLAPQNDKRPAYVPAEFENLEEEDEF